MSKYLVPILVAVCLVVAGGLLLAGVDEPPAPAPVAEGQMLEGLISASATSRKCFLQCRVAAASHHRQVPRRCSFAERFTRLQCTQVSDDRLPMCFLPPPAPALPRGGADAGGG